MRKSNVLSSVTKNVSEENLFFHHVPLLRIPQNYVCKLPKDDLQNDVKFSLGKCFLATQETLLSSTRKT